MRENYVYPIIIKREEEIYLVTFPNFPDQMTEAETEMEAIQAAQEVLSLCICDNEDMGQENPKPMEPEEIALEENEKLIYVNLWMPYFRQVQKVIYVKKTLTIPQWLDDMAKEKKINFSAVLTQGLKRELGIDSKD